MATPKGLFTPNVVRVATAKPPERPFSAGALRWSGEAGPRGYFRAPRQPDMPKVSPVGK